MRNLIICLCVSFSSFLYGMDSPQESGLKAYQEGNFTEAIEAWSQIEAADRGPSLWYNLGNAYYKSQELGMARWCYEKATLLDPHQEDYVHNLNMVKSQLVDVLEQSPYVSFRDSLEEFILALSEYSWVLFTILFSIIAAAAWLVYWMSHQLPIRKRSFTIAVVGSCLSLLFLWGSRWSYQLVNNSAYGVITTDKVDIFHAPDTQGQRAFVLHEGCKVEIIKVLGNWQLIELSNGQSGWLEGKQINRL